MLLDLSTWWFALGTVERTFWTFGLVSNAFFVLYVVMQLLGGHDSDAPDSHHPGDAAAGCTLLSIRSLLSLGMFMGYTG